MSDSATASATAAVAWDARVGLSAAAAVVLSVMTALWLGLPDPWWAATTAWRIADPEPTAALRRGFQLVVATLAGAAFGYLAAGLARDVMAMQVVLLFTTATVGVWKRFTSPVWSFGWFLGAITALLVLVQSLSGSEGLYAFAVSRTLEILCGVVMTSIVEVVLLSGRVPAPAPPKAAAAPAVPAQELLRVALLAGWATLLVVLLWSLLQLPAVTQVAISVLAVLDRDVIRLRKRGWQRLLGCLVGGACGLTLLASGMNGLLVWLTALGGGVFLLSRVALGAGAWAYFGVQGGMALIAALVVGTGPPDHLLPVLERLVGITLGVGLVVILSFLFASSPIEAGPQ